MKKEDVFRKLKDNKNFFLAKKKSEFKISDSVSGKYCFFAQKENTEKIQINTVELLLKDKITVDVIINTTNILDSHGDVHINGLWKKSLNELRTIYHLQEHKMTFEHVISDKIKAYTKNISVSELGFPFKGNCEALVFSSEIEKTRNKYMFEQYARGYVREHSVGMHYVNLFLCINSSEKYYFEEKENWDKYIVNVINKTEAEEQGWFWAVTEAKLIEGSAVLRGSNYVTPTIGVTEIEPEYSTHSYIEPSEDTRKSFLEKIGSKI